MNRNNWSGAITVYLSIIMAAVIILSGVLIDMVRIKVAEIQVRRALNTAANSTLASYHTKLKEDYGLFALHQNDSSSIHQTLERYLTNNLMAMDMGSGEATYEFLKGMMIKDEYRRVKFIDLFDYRIDGINVEPIYNLTENEIIRHQIAEYMKYRAPVQLTEDFLKKVEYVKTTADHTDAYKQKTKIDKNMSKIEKMLQRLQKDLDKVNEFQKSYYLSVNSEEALLQNYITSGIEEYAYAEYSSMNLDTQDEAEKSKIAEFRQEAKQRYGEVSKATSEAMNAMNENISGCVEAARDAMNQYQNIANLTKSVQGDIKKLESIIAELEKQTPNNDAGFNEALTEDVKKWQQLLKKEGSAAVKEPLENNIRELNSIQSNLVEITDLMKQRSRDYLTNISEGLLDISQLDSVLDIRSNSDYLKLIDEITDSQNVQATKTSAGIYANVSNVIESGDKPGNNDADGRKKTAREANRSLKDAGNSSDGDKTIENPQTLPSYYNNGHYPNKILSQDVLQRINENEEEHSRVMEFDVSFEEESEFAENAFGYITNLANLLKEKTIHLRDEVYVNEYILHAFKDAVEIKSSITDNKQITTFFQKGEVEYILHGSNREDVNKQLVRGEILLIRFGINTLHVYSDSPKRMRALEIATAAAGLTGFGVPVLHNLIMCSWGMQEAISDVEEIYEGKSVPFFKTAHNWKSDVVSREAQVNSSDQNENNIMNFNYHDYLRLLLLVKNSEIKMNRIEDLIQLNMQCSNPSYKLMDYNTYMIAQVSISIRYWSMTKSFVPSKQKTQDGRHKINVELWKGY